MKKHAQSGPQYFKAPISSSTASRRPFLFALILVASVLTLAVGSGVLPTGRSASRADQTDSAKSTGH